MHLTIAQWMRRLWHDNPALFHGQRVLDIGALSVSGSAASLFADCQYTGLDARPGPGVDVVCFAHTYKPEQLYDVVVCCSTLEHDPFWQQTLDNIPRLLAPGGTLLLTFPTTGWPEHELDCAPIPNYYRNLTDDDVLPFIMRDFDTIKIHYGDRETFIIATGRKAKQDE